MIYCLKNKKMLLEQLYHQVELKSFVKGTDQIISCYTILCYKENAWYFA